jgi:ATP-binding cassette subfamily C protein
MIRVARDLAPLLDRGARRWLALYLAATVIASALETVGVGMVFVFFQVALDPTKLSAIPGIGDLLPASWRADQARLVAVVSLVVFIAFLARTVMQLATVWLSQDIRRRIQFALSQELFRGYLAQPYAWHLGRKPSELYFNVSSNTGAVAQNCILASVELVGVAILLAFFMVALGWLKPVETLVAFVLVAIVGAGYFAVVHRRSLRWGEASVEAGEAWVRVASEPLRGIKTVKVLGLERFFAAAFDDRIRRWLDMNLRQGLAQAAPRFMMELVLVTTLLGAVTAALALGQTPAEIIPTMALFGAAAYRLVPAASRVASLLQYYRFSEPALRIVGEDLAAVRATRLEQPPAAALPASFDRLRLDGIGFSYPGADRPVLRGLTLEVRRGELVALVGASGAGKTTVVDVLLGLLAPARGSVLLDGRELGRRPLGLFGYVPQDPFVIQASLRGNIAIGVPKDRVDDAAVRRAAEAASLGDVIARLPAGINTPVGEGATGLSGGERQRLGLARALYHDPLIMVLDEPTAALDSVTEAEVSRALHALRGRKTVIVIAHRLSSVRDFDRIVFLRDGVVAATGTFDELYAAEPEFRGMAERLSVAATAPADARAAGARSAAQ